MKRNQADATFLAYIYMLGKNLEYVKKFHKEIQDDMKIEQLGRRGGIWTRGEG